VIDDPVVQRLRYIGQAGLSHLVFPEVRTSRFGHSLGAMHLASRFLSSTLENATPQLRKQIERLMKDAVKEVTGGYSAPPQQISDILTDDGLRSAASVSPNARTSALLMEQGLRLAALLHDLGHLPFSHDFEYALQQLFEQNRTQAEQRFPKLSGQQGLAIHERIGYCLAQTLVRKTFGNMHNTPEGEIARSAFQIAERILLAQPPPDPTLVVAPRSQLYPDALWWWLHTLMAGEIDVDRCDYLLRDARTYGFEFASYDLDRLANHLTVVRRYPRRNVLETAVLPQGVSAVESFLLARYRAYTWGPFHHKVSQIAAALQQSILIALRPAFAAGAGSSPLKRFLDDIERIAANNTGNLHTTPRGLLDRFRGYDDGWMMGQIRDAARATGLKDFERAWLDLVCWRKPGPKSLWKRASDFPTELRQFNQNLPKRNDPLATPRWRVATDKLTKQGILVIRHHFSPYKLESTSTHSMIKVIERDGKLRALTEISPMTAALPDLWNADVHVYASALKPTPTLSARVIKELQ
jgi:HD superfamily phosphohydrolase